MPRKMVKRSKGYKMFMLALNTWTSVTAVITILEGKLARETPLGVDVAEMWLKRKCLVVQKRKGNCETSP